MSDPFLLHDAIGEMLVKLLGDEAQWILTYHRDNEPVRVIATLPPEQIIDVFESQIAALRRGTISGMTQHETGGDPA